MLARLFTSYLYLLLGWAGVGWAGEQSSCGVAWEAAAGHFYMAHKNKSIIILLLFLAGQGQTGWHLLIQDPVRLALQFPYFCLSPQKPYLKHIVSLEQAAGRPCSLSGGGNWGQGRQQRLHATQEEHCIRSQWDSRVA